MRSRKIAENRTRISVYNFSSSGIGGEVPYTVAPYVASRLAYIRIYEPKHVKPDAYRMILSYVSQCARDVNNRSSRTVHRVVLYTFIYSISLRTPAYSAQRLTDISHKVQYACSRLSLLSGPTGRERDSRHAEPARRAAGTRLERRPGSRQGAELWDWEATSRVV